MKKSKRGFTLMEILIVVAIIGILSTIVIINVSGAKNKSRYAKVIADMNEIGKAVNLYKVTNFTYPDDLGPNILPPQLNNSGYLSSWPTPPCPGNGYDYDYQNWLSSLGTHISIGFRKYNGAPWTNIYYLDLYNFAAGALTDNAWGTDIKNVPEKVITCKEGT